MRGKFGKRLLVVELVAVVVISLLGFVLAYMCVKTGYTGGLPWIVSMVAPSWAAYGASKIAYDNKVLKESMPYIEAEAQNIKRDC